MAYQPKNYRKFVATAATATLVASAIAPVASAADFKDVSSKYKEAVDFVVSKGASGTSATTFGTDANIKRGDAAVLLVKVLGLDTDAPDAGFTDVNSRLDPYVNALKEAGITSGKTKTTFAPDALITRGELAVWIQKGFDLEGTSDLKFTDVNTNYQTAVQALVANGVTTGISSTAFGTTQNAKRGDYALFLYRADQATAEDTKAPELKYDGSTSVTVENGADFTAPTVTATDNVDKDVKVTSIITDADGKQLSAIDTKVAGTYKITYSATDAAGNKAEELVITVTVKEPATPEVTSVSAANATQIEIKFNQAVDAKSLFTNGTDGAFKSGVVSIRSIDSVTDGTLTGELSSDGKVLTITSTQLLEKRYDVAIDKVVTANGKNVEKYSEIINIAKDVTAPSITGTERLTANQVKIKFSEPMASAGSATFKLADGTTVNGINGQGTLVEDGKAIILDLSGNSVPVSKDITATIIGAADKAGNLLTPNPATVTFQKGDKDGVAPTVSSVTQTGAKTFEIKFSEAIVGKPTVAIDNATVNQANVVIDSKDATKVTVTADSVLDGDKIVTISGFVDGSGENGATTNRVVKFVKDTVAPKLVSSAVVTDTTDGAEYLEFSFDKDVKLSNAKVDVTDGSYVKDYVTTQLDDSDITAQPVEYKDSDNHKVIRVKIATLLGNKSVEGARYSLDLAFTGLSSEADVPFTTGQATFTRGTDGTPANNVVLELEDTNPIVAGSDNNQVVVTFKQNVDAATATNAANYIVGGAVVERATVSSTNLKQVTLTLKENSNTFSGVRNVTIQNVKAAGSSVAMATATKTVNLKENVAPTVTAQLQSDLKTIKLTFSENVYQDSSATPDFGVLVGTDAYKWDADSDPDTPDVSFEKDSGLGTTEATATNTVNIVLPNTVTADQLTKGLSLKALTNLDVKDVAGNKLSVSSLND